MGRREELQKQTQENLDAQAMPHSDTPERQREFNNLIHQRLLRIENGEFDTPEEKPTDPARRMTPSMGVEPPPEPPDPKATGKRRIG